MREKLEALQAEALAALAEANSQQALNEIRVKYMGKKGALTEVLRGMGALSPEERPVIGQLANEVRGAIEQVLEEKAAELERQETERRLAAETIDVTLPGRSLPRSGASAE